ncbi:YetF domain-containing protein [Desulfosporosinus shakirovi]|uniref:YetF domain-containing protein n=1 Tax=Desulfosporosinus shakirovi TaxID=2885154 RepID=UPI001E459D80|nr:YetF domain-containing protein [Desulfosporosinus sp. SRJS8]MCB8816936.1 DUF421 domain-containing protein [Desulfosporosinus sp. SRJS8]
MQIPIFLYIHTAVAIILIGFSQKVLTTLIIKHRKFGHLLTFEPTIVIQDGQLIMNNLKRIRYSVNNVLHMLREKDIFDLSDVRMFKSIFLANSFIARSRVLLQTSSSRRLKRL